MNAKQEAKLRRDRHTLSQIQQRIERAISHDGNGKGDFHLEEALCGIADCREHLRKAFAKEPE
jgi:hypothetical protein